MKNRIYSLDGLRGICALLVAFSHGMKFLDIQGITHIEDLTVFDIHTFPLLLTKVLLSLSNATGAVFIFFMLSSYVLTLSLEKVIIQNKSITIFYIKRLFRLAPAYIFSITLILVSLLFLQKIPITTISSFFSTFYHFPLSIQAFFSNLFLIQTSFNPISWSLQVEVLGSLFLPLFYFFCCKTTTKISIVFFVFLIILGILFRGTSPFHYLYIFYLGIFLKNMQPFFSLVQQKKNVSVAMWIIAVCLFTLPRGILLPSSTTISQIAEVIGAWLMIGIILYSHANFITTFLSGRIPQFYGKISYSFYLLNFIITFALIALISSVVSSPVLMHYGLLINMITAFCSIGITTFFATLSYQFIEQPFMELSFRIAHAQKVHQVNKQW